MDQVLIALAMTAGLKPSVDQWKRIVETIQGVNNEILGNNVDGFSRDEMNFMMAGNMIQAVKGYRERIGCGLREAVDVVRPYMDKNGWIKKPTN